MARIKISLSVKDLLPGMIAAEEFKLDSLTLITPGVEFSQAVIDKLKDRYLFNKIMVYKEIETIAEDSINSKDRTVLEIAKDLHKYSIELKSIFENLHLDQISDRDEMRNFMKKIQKELDSPNSLIKNIVLYGSGKDTVYKHSVNVAALSAILGRWTGFPENEIDLLTYSGLLHDFGKTKVGDDILNKAEALNAKELKAIRNHPIEGYNYAKLIPFIDSSVSYGVLMHHERLDGSGYPLGIMGDKIPKFARIIAIVDIFDAINSNRAYKKSKGPFEVLEILQAESIEKLDYKYCTTFIEKIINYYIGEKVLLNNNMVCKIVSVDVKDLSSPLLLCDSDFIDLKLHKELKIVQLVL